MIFKNKKLSKLKKNYQYIFIGSGPANISTLIELIKKKYNCLLIEAGDELFNEVSQNFYNGSTIGDDYPNLSIARLRQFGGSSNHWGGSCRPIDNIDFNKWDIKYNQIKEYIPNACKILDINNKFDNYKVDKNIQQIQYQKSNVNFYDKYFSFLKEHEYVDIVLNSAVTDLLTEEDIITGVKINNIDTLNFKSIYVLGAGGIENTRILLNAARKNKIFQNNNIGKFWMDHPYYTAGQLIYNDKKLDNYINKKFFKNYTNQTIFKLSDSFQSKNKILNAAFFFNPINNQENLVKRQIKNMICKSKFHKKIGKMLNRDIVCGDIIQVSLEQPPTKKNFIALSNKKDLYENNQVELHWKKPDKTYRTIIKSLEEIGSFFIRENIGRIAIFNNIIDKKSLEHLGGYHHMGGTRIGLYKDISVVDTNLKYHDLKNLYINGSSIFQTSSYCNPTLTIVMFALRLANHLEKIKL